MSSRNAAGLILTDEYVPRHAKNMPRAAADLGTVDLAIMLQSMMDSLSPVRGKHRRGAENWYAYCLALRELSGALMGSR
jgi:hypothetical protein